MLNNRNAPWLLCSRRGMFFFVVFFYHAHVHKLPAEPPSADGNSRHGCRHERPLWASPGYNWTLDFTLDSFHWAMLSIAASGCLCCEAESVFVSACSIRSAGATNAASTPYYTCFFFRHYKETLVFALQTVMGDLSVRCN